MSFLSLWNRVNTLGGYILGSGGGTKRQVILSAGEEKFMLPVTALGGGSDTERGELDEQDGGELVHVRITLTTIYGEVTLDV